MTTSEPAIHARGLSKSYRLYKNAASVVRYCLDTGHSDAYSTFDALRNIDLDIKKGDRMGIVGRNGAGKTTLLKLLIGHVRPSAGSLVVNGSVHAMMKTDLGIHAHFTGRQNILSSLAYSNIFGDEAKEKLADIAEFTELGPYLDQPFMNYSLGMQSRLMFGVATAVHPDILIVDEMLGAGDSYFSAKSSKRMEQLIDHGCSLLLVSHNTQQVMQFCDKAIWMRSGQIYASGTARDIINAYDVYIEKEIEKSKSGLPVTDATDKRQNLMPYNQEDYKTILNDGKKVYRWGIPKGLEVDAIDLYADGTATPHIQPGQSIEIRFSIKILETRSFKCRYLLTFWDMKSKRIARLENNYDEFDAIKGDKREIRVSMNPLQILDGIYTVNISIYDMDKNASTYDGRSVRMDFLAHCIDVKIENATPSEMVSLSPRIKLIGRIGANS